VLDPELGFRGRVLAIENGQAEVQGPTARLRLPAERLVVDRRPPPRAGAAPMGLERRPEPRAAEPELDVRGQRAEEARAAVRERVDAAAMAGLPRLRVIHGRGTGALRAAVRDELGRHPLVARAEQAPPEEGGDGATMAVLEDP
jgi:DNA mismatch repair protein MutS2